MKSLVQSFYVALLGIRHALLFERNFRLQWLCSLLVLLLNLIVPFTLEQQILLLILTGGVLSFELMNSSIEYTCNASGHTFNSQKKGAKDLAASSVLIFSITAFISLYLIFYSENDLFTQSLCGNIFATLSLAMIFLTNFIACINKLSLPPSIICISTSIICHIIIIFNTKYNINISLLTILIHGLLCYTHIKRCSRA